LAVATASSVAFTPDGALFVSVTGASGVRCEDLRAVSLWCLAGQTDTGLTLSRVVALATLAVVAAGFRPRWTCIPHWYVTFSLALSITQPNGGDHVAQILTLLLIPICLGDDRTWQWTKLSRPLPASWRGAAYASALVIRLQLAIVYTQAGGAKLLAREWRDGTAIFSIVRSPDYGAPQFVRAMLGPGASWLIAGLTWGTVAVELAIAVTVLATRRMRAYALVLAIGLHLAIGATMGLVSFAVIMIGSLTIAYAGTVEQTMVRRTDRDRAMSNEQRDVTGASDPRPAIGARSAEQET
jgi:antimicrobial peptide system SdpB family protein